MRQVLVNGESYPLVHTGMTAWRVEEVPLGPGENDLQLLGIDLNGEMIGADSVTVTSTAVFEPPAINALRPSEGVAGDSIEILGANFMDAIEVYFGGTLSPSITRTSSTRVLVEVPEGSGAVQVVVRNPNGQESGDEAIFTYLSLIHI